MQSTTSLSPGMMTLGARYALGGLAMGNIAVEACLEQQMV